MQATEGSVNDQRGNTSEVASIIRKFTEPTRKYGDIYSDGKPNGEFVRSNLSFAAVIHGILF